MSINGRSFRNALGRFATGVCVITRSTADGRNVGMTANSFASVSLDPPLVLWSIQNSSDLFADYTAAGRFAINVLALEQAHMSHTYARKGDHLLDPEHCKPGRHGTPLIRNALASFECDLFATHPGGDHTIIVGKVRDLDHRPTGKPLLFSAGAYGELH